MRPDLAGRLSGMVQFAQSHTVDPAGNAAKQMPTLTSEREALLLVTPDPALGEIESLSLAVTVDGHSKPLLALRHPNELYKSDYNNGDGRPDVTYSHRAWSVVLPWDWVKPGLRLSLTDDKGRNGVLAAEKIDFAAPAELVVHSVRLGMLTDPPVSNDHWFRVQPAKAAADYFQTVPLARITAAYYEDVRLDKVMVANGSIYTSASTDQGGTYGGDMRENTAKSTFSVGINLANYGVTSSGMQSQSNPRLFQSAVIHHAQGHYANGVQGHGLSGGNGILTLYSARGNEFSHEIGHHYGLGHYPGENGENRFWSGHHHDSGWGFIGYRKRMRANLHWSRGKNDGLTGMPVFQDTYSFASDAMSGGHYSSSLSAYTHYTGYSTKTAIQPSLNRPMLSASSATGYVQWNASTRTMEPTAPVLPKAGEVWYNGAAGAKYQPPRRAGVPVVTLLGGYDPDTGKALIYPALRGNWGNVFDLPATPLYAVSSSERQCWLSVSFASGHTQRIALAGKRLQTNLVNKLHVNLAQDEQPSAAQLLCQAPADAAPQELYRLAIAQGLPAMAPAVVIGKEAGYKALRQVEMPELDAALQAQAGKPVVNLSTSARVLYDSYTEYASELSAPGQAQWSRYTEQWQKAERLNRWMYAYSDKLGQPDPAAQKALLAFIDQLGLKGSGPVIPPGQSLKNGSNCLKLEGSEAIITHAAQCTGAANEQWILDARGSIRSAANLGLCLTDQGGSNRVKPVTCDMRNDNQVWDTSTPNKINRGTRCFDLNTGSLDANGRGTLITYGCTNGGNQRWAGLVPSNNLLLTLVNADNIGYLAKLPATP